MDDEPKPYKQHAFDRAGCLSVLFASALVLAACGGGGSKAPSQIAAKVDKEEISIHQVNQVLQRQAGLKPEQMDAASRQALERLIDQEVAVQKAQSLKIDREPRVVQAMEAARREVIAAAYAERLGESVTRPTAQEISKYYADNPALFSERRVYNLQEVVVEAKPEQLDDLRNRLKAAKSAGDLVDQLKAADYRFSSNAAVRAAEQLPLAMLPEFAKLKDGQSLLRPTPTGAQIVILVSSRTQPIDAAAASPLIDQFLVAERRRRLFDTDLKALRATAKVEYIGKFAAAASAPPAPGADYVPLAVSPTASGTIDPATISKGLGFK